MPIIPNEILTGIHPGLPVWCYDFQPEELLALASLKLESPSINASENRYRFRKIRWEELSRDINKADHRAGHCPTQSQRLVGTASFHLRFDLKPRQYWMGPNQYRVFFTPEQAIHVSKQLFPDVWEEAYRRIETCP